MKELQAKAKVTQTMTRDGLVMENQADGTVENVSSREAEQDYSTDSEGKTEKILERAEEVLQVGAVLEVVGIHFARLGYQVGLHIVGIFNHIQGDICLCQDIASHFQNLGMRHGGSSHLDGGASQ